MNTEYSKIAKDYKRRIAGGFQLVEGAKLMEKLSGTDYMVTRKLDGALHLLFYRDGDVVAVSTGGNERRALPCLEEFANLASKAGLRSAMIAAELYAPLSETGRERVCDVATALADESLHGRLRLAPFDILELDGEEFKAEHYKETLARLNGLFRGSLVAPVEGRAASSRQEVQAIFDEWVTEQGSEGLVVHSEQPFIFKVKPRHTIDAAIVGYTESDEAGKVRDLLVAVMRPDGALQVFGATGNGMTETQKEQLYGHLSGMHVHSEYIETDSRNVAFKMVRPETVAELSVVDLVAENSAGEAKMNMLVRFVDDGYSVEAQTPGVAAHHMVLEGIRDDKAVNATDVRLSQITDLCAFSERKAVSMNNLPASEMLSKRIFTKGAGEKLMIQKYVIWKTNKEASGPFPAYVLHYTDYSISRKEQLKRDIRVSDNRTQVETMMAAMITENVKKGWEERAI